MSPARIEFWTIDGELLAGIDTEATPPPIGARVQIKRIDYTVAQIEYTVDRAGEYGTQFRRSVFLVKIDGDEERL